MSFGCCLGADSGSVVLVWNNARVVYNCLHSVSWHCLIHVTFVMMKIFSRVRTTLMNTSDMPWLISWKKNWKSQNFSSCCKQTKSSLHNRTSLKKKQSMEILSLYRIHCTLDKKAHISHITNDSIFLMHVQIQFLCMDPLHGSICNSVENVAVHNVKFHWARKLLTHNLIYSK